MQVQIHELQLDGFKGAGKRSWQFGSRVEIYGDNYTGKTTIAEAIVYGLTGLNLEGSPRTDSLIPLEAKGLRVTVSFTGVDGQQHVITRTKGPKNNKVLLDGVDATAAQVERVVGPTEAFLAAFWPGGLGALQGAEARNFFMRLVKLPPWEEVAGRLLDLERDLLKPWAGRQDMDTLLTELRDHLRKIERENTENEGAKRTLQEQLKEPLPEKVNANPLAEELQMVRAEIDKLTVPPAPLPVAELMQAMNQAKADYEAAKAQVPAIDLEPGTNCPKCGQAVTQEVIDTLKSSADKDPKVAAAKRQMAAALQRGRELKPKLDAAIAENKRREAEYFSQMGERLKQLRAREGELSRALTAAQAANAKYYAACEAREKAQAKLAEIAADEQANQHAINRTKAEIGAVQQFLLKRAEIIAEQVQAHLNRASIQLFEVVKSTKEIKPTFKLLYDQKPYVVLSASERVRLGLEISGLVKRLTGITYPTFIDNAESLTHFDAPPGQTFVAWVVEGQQLTVTNKEVIGDDEPAIA